MNNWIGLAVSFLFILLIMVIATILQKKKRLSEEGSRKFIHIGVGNWWILAMIFFDNGYFAMILPIIFIILNFISYKYDLVKAMERNEDKTLGTVYYPISLLVLVILTFLVVDKPFIGAIGVLIMAYADGLAAVIGKKNSLKKNYS